MEPISLHGKVALITGGSRGMGREMAIAFARAGAAGVTVTAVAASDETRAGIQSELDSVASEISKVGGKALAVQADVCRWEQCCEAVRRTVEAFGGLHILVNNAGKSQRYHGARNLPFWETDPDGWADVMDTNAVGPYRMAKAAVPEMLKARWGRIINLSKSFHAMHEPYAGAYGSSKAALEAESLSWAQELKDTGVTVNSIAPGGPVDTKFGRGTVRGVGLNPTVITPIACWLASIESDGVTGCRFVAKKWDESRPNADAANGCREPSVFAE